MKILQVNQHYAPVGGAEQYLMNVSARLEQRDLAVAVLYAVETAQDFRVPGRQETSLACLLQGSGLSSAERFRRIRRTIDDLNPDVIQVHNLDEPDVLAQFAELRPTVQFVHAHSVKFCPGDGKFYRRSHEVCQRPFGPYCLIAPYLHQCGSQRPWRIASNYSRVKHWLEVAPTLSKLMVASHYMKRELIQAGVEADRIVVNPIGVDMEAIPDFSLSPSGDEAMVLFVGRLYEVKGPQVLLEALKYLDISSRVVFVGDGPDRKRLEQAAAGLSPRHVIEFVGWVGPSEVMRLYQRARVVVVPSVWPEPFGMVGVEAFKHGKPVVAFNVGGISEWLKDGENGFLVAVKDVLAMTTAIKSILLDPERATEMGRQARAMAAEHFNIERHIDVLLQTYEEAINLSQPQKRKEAKDPSAASAISAVNFL